MTSDLRVMLAARRTTMGISQRYLAKLMNTSQSHICELETGVHAPGIETLQAWAFVLGFTVTIRLTDEDGNTYDF